MEARASNGLLTHNAEELHSQLKISTLLRYFHGYDERKKVNEVVTDEDDEVGSSVHAHSSPHFASFVLDVFLLSEVAC